MGSVPRINRLLITVFIHSNKILHKIRRINNIINYSKGVSLLSKQLPFTLKLVLLYLIISNSKAA